MIIPNDMISHVGKIFQGEYAIERMGKNPYIIDIGANVGGFAVWAHEYFIIERVVLWLIVKMRK